MDNSVVTWVGAGALLVLVIAVLLLAVRNRRLSGQLSALRQELQSAVARTQGATGVARQVGVVVNIIKHDADRVVRMIHSECSKTGMPAPLVYGTTAEDPGYAMARQAVQDGCDVLIAAGGDGTVRAVATELIPHQIPLGIIPLGTGNLFARNIGLPFDDLPACVDEALHGIPHQVDTLALQLQHGDGKRTDEISLVIAGGGLDAEVMSDTRDQLKERAGWLAYGEAGLRHVSGARKHITVQLEDGEPDSFRVRSVLLANCGTLQGGVDLVPSARYDDGYLDIVLFSPRHALDWGRIVAKTVLRLATEIPVMTVRQARSSWVRMEEPMPFQIDGDPVGEVIGVHADVAPGSLTVNGVRRPVSTRSALTPRN